MKSLPLLFLLLLPSTFASTFSFHHKRNAADKLPPRQDTSASTSTIGILPSTGTGTPALGGHSLTGHGPAVQPQPGAGTGNDTTTTTSIGTDTTDNTSNTTDTNPETSSSETGNGNGRKHLEVTDYQYTSRQSRPRVEITIKYGAQHVVQTWEVRNGTLYQVHPKGMKGCGTSSASAAMGTGMVGGGGGGMAGAEGGSSMSANGTVGEDGTSAMGGSAMVGTGSPIRQARPDGVRPGFTGP
ncbi:MAG: hypothetical protein Q9170_006941 [Blastenia crenularia]